MSAISGGVTRPRHIGFAAPGLGAIVLAGVAVAVAAAAETPSTLASPLTAPGRWREAWIVGLVVAFAAYAAAVLATWTTAPRIGAVLAIGAAVQLAPLAAPLMLSRDAYVYWDYGRAATVHHANPYHELPSAWPNDPAYALMGADWHRAYDAYGPAWTLLAEAGARASGDSAHATRLWYKALGAAGALALLGAAAFAGRRPGFAVAAVGWNPLFALHFAGGGHNDALMLALVLFAIGFARRGHRFASGAAWTLAIAVKWLPILYVPLELARLRRRFPLVAFAATAVIAAIVSTLFFGPWWLRAVVPISNQLRATGTRSLPHWLSDLGGTPRQWAVALTAVFAAVYVWLLREAWRGRSRLGLAAGLFLLTLTWLVPWYAVWALAPAAAEDDRSGIALGVLLSAYFLFDALPL